MEMDHRWSTIRQSRGISLQEIAQSTKIGIHALKAIESGDFQKLPGGIYNTSYIRQYARAIDFDEDELLVYYRLHTPAIAQPREAQPTSSPHSRFVQLLRESL